MFKLTNQEICGDDANQTAADFEFEMLGEVIHAVMLRLSSDLPRIKVERSVVNVGGGRTTDRC